MGKKLVYFLREMQTLGVNSSGIIRIESAKFSEYYFYKDVLYKHCIKNEEMLNRKPCIE